MYKSRINYWSCSKFANWVRGSNKPGALTSEDWEKWTTDQKEKHPIRFWMSETLLNKIQDIVYFPYDIYRSIKIYLFNRFVDKTHYLKTNLTPGQFHEFDTRILHGLFSELVDFVEIECAALGLWTSKRRFFRRRNPEAGKKHLEWAASLIYDEDHFLKKNDKKYGKPTPQAISAKETLELYDWWKQRPDRPDPYEVSGWRKHCEENKNTITKEGKEIFKKLEKIEQEYEKEDDKMLMRLIKIRKSLWT